MLTVSQVLNKGMQAQRSYCLGGEFAPDNPYEDPEFWFITEQRCYYNRYSRRNSTRKVRVRIAINFNEVWQIGWDLAEYLESKNGI